MDPRRADAPVEKSEGAAPPVPAVSSQQSIVWALLASSPSLSIFVTLLTSVSSNPGRTYELGYMVPVVIVSALMAMAALSALFVGRMIHASVALVAILLVLTVSVIHFALACAIVPT